MPEIVRVKVEDKWYTVEVGDLTRRPVVAVVDGYSVEVQVQDPVTESASPEARPASRPTAGRRARSPRPALSASPPPARPAAVENAPGATRLFRSPMPGAILSIEVNAGDQVVTGDPICVLEAMKMQQTLRADWSGVVKTVMVAVGQQVMGGAPIVELE